MIKNNRKIYKLAKIGYFTLAGILAVGPLFTGTTLFAVGSVKRSNIEKGYNDNDKFIEACLNDNYLRRLYNERMEPAKLQYESGEISQKDLRDIENQYIEDIKTIYSVDDYVDLSGKKEEYDNAQTIMNAGGYTALSGVLAVPAGLCMLYFKERE